MIALTNIDQFLSESVFYPCSGLDGAPIKFLGKRFQRFFFTDYSISRADFDNCVSQQGFRGYRLCSIDDLNVESVFGASWEGISRIHEKSLSRIHFEWSNPFVVFARFERLHTYTDNHGPSHFELIFSRCEAITTFLLVFSRRCISPQCLAYIRSGIGFGGNFSGFPQELRQVLLANSGGLPEYVLYDKMGASQSCGDYLDLVEQYQPIERWDYRTEGYGMGNVTLAKRSVRPSNNC